MDIIRSVVKIRRFLGAFRSCGENYEFWPKQILKLIFEVDFEDDVVIITLKR